MLLHASVIGLLVYGWWSFRQQSRPPPTLAIDATVVDGRSLGGTARARPPTPTPPKPAPPPDAQAQRAEAERLAEAKREEQRSAERQAEQARAESERKDQEETKRKAREAERKAAEETERNAQEEAKRKAQQEAERERIAAAKREAEEKRQAQEAKLNAESQAELQRSLADEERINAVRSSGAMASWTQQITARIQHAWIRPPSARAGLDCTLYVTQVPGGEIVSVKLGTCNGDEAVRESIQVAAYRASPLPPPPDPALFVRDLEIHFRPTD